MLRYALLTLFVAYLCILSFKDWYRALCYSLPLIAVLERPDMPRAILGISGLNPYNVILICVLLGWLSQKNNEGLRWIVPPSINFYLKLYLFVVVVSFFRMITDFEGLDEYCNHFYIPFFTVGELVKDDLVNAWKWLIPGMLLCHGTITKEREELAVHCILITGLLLAVQIFAKMWPALVGLDDLHTRGLRVFDRDIGYHGTMLAPMMASCAWGCVVYATFSSNKRRIPLGYLSFGLCSIALMTTGGRGGSIAWVLCGVLFGFLKWKKILFLGPVFVFLGLLIIPGAKERYLSGFTEDSYQKGISERLGTIDDEGRDLYAITSGRVIVWPRALEKIREAPLFGFGMRAYQKEGVIMSLHDDGTLPMDAGFWTHPHNAYLRFLLNAGVLGLSTLLMFYFKLLREAVRIFRQNEGERYPRLIAGMFLAYVGVELLNGMASGTFFPYQGGVLVWCVTGLFMRSIGGRRMTSTM